MEKGVREMLTDSVDAGLYVFSCYRMNGQCRDDSRWYLVRVGRG